MQILITNLYTSPLSLDFKFAERRQLRQSLAVGASVDVSETCSLDELNRHPDVTALRTAGKISVQVVEPLDLSQQPIARYTTAADSLLAADVIGATTEAAHTSVTIAADAIGTARRLIKFRARLHVIAANGADTWTFRARLGGLAGVLLQASAAINITAADIYLFEGAIEVRTLGASGTFDSTCAFSDFTGANDAIAAVIAGAVDTTGDVDLTITGECSTNNAGNQVSLRHLSVEVLPA